MELTNFAVLADWLAIDADLAWSHARFRDHDPLVGDYIPGAVTTTANIGVTIDHLGPWFGAMRLRYFGPRPLIEDNSVRSSSSALTNLRVGYKFDARTQVALDVYNLFDRHYTDPVATDEILGARRWQIPQFGRSAMLRTTLHF